LAKRKRSASEKIFVTRERERERERERQRVVNVEPQLLAAQLDKHRYLTREIINIQSSGRLRRRQQTPLNNAMEMKSSTRLRVRQNSTGMLKKQRGKRMHSGAKFRIKLGKIKQDLHA
jgi:hypothetical protein